MSKGSRIEALQEKIVQANEEIANAKAELAKLGCGALSAGAPINRKIELAEARIANSNAEISEIRARQEAMAKEATEKQKAENLSFGDIMRANAERMIAERGSPEAKAEREKMILETQATLEAMTRASNEAREKQRAERAATEKVKDKSIAEQIAEKEKQLKETKKQMAETEKNIADAKSQLEETKKASIAAQKAVLDEIERQMKAHQEQQIAAEREAMAKQIAQKKAEIAEADKKHKEEMEAMLQQWVKTEAARVAEQEAAKTKADNFDKSLMIVQEALNPDSGNHKMAVKQLQEGRDEILLGVARGVLDEHRGEIEQIGLGVANLAGLGSAIFDSAFGGDESSDGF